MRRIEGIAAVAEVNIVARGACGEFRHVQDADFDRARRVQPLQYRRGCRCDLILKDSASARGNLSRAVEHVLVCQRHAVQRTAPLAAFAFAITFARRFHRGFAVDADEAVAASLPCASLIKAGFGQRHRRHAASRDTFGGIRKIKQREIGRHRARLCSAAAKELGSSPNAS